jgi:uncharacterized protein (DUF433 family)
MAFMPFQYLPPQLVALWITGRRDCQYEPFSLTIYGEQTRCRRSACALIRGAHDLGVTFSTRLRPRGRTPWERSACDSASYTPAMANTQFDRITVSPDRLGGKPCIRELRISVGMVVQMVAAGKTIDEILAEYPYLEAEDVKQALAYSAALAENEYHLVLRPSA